MKFVALILIPCLIQGLPLTQVSDLLYGKEYKGTWLSQSGLNDFNFLTESEGDAFMIFLLDTKNSDSDLIGQLEIQFLNPTYPELRFVIGIFDLNGYQDDTMYNLIILSVWAGQGILNYTDVYKFKRVGQSKDKCQIDYTVDVNFNAENPNAQNAQIQMKLQSRDKNICQVDLKAILTLDQTRYLLEIIIYCVMAMIVCFTQFLCVTKLCKSLLENEEDVSKISLISVGFITLSDSYVCLQNLYLALINYNYFQYFILPAFFYFMLATTCDMKLIWIIWRSRHFNDLFDQQHMRKAITIFFAQFYFSLITYFILMYFFELDHWFICLTGLLMMPQIIHNARLGNNPKFINSYIFGILCPSIIYPIYARGCPKNIKGTEPSLTFCMIYASIYCFQLLLLYVQYKLGPRSFIPKCFLPKQYQYFKTLNIQENEEYDECAICLNSIVDEPAGEDNGEQKLIVKQIMVTPCNHQFHISCLRSWIDIKMQCPTCRSNLPPIPQ